MPGLIPKREAVQSNGKRWLYFAGDLDSGSNRFLSAVAQASSCKIGIKVEAEGGKVGKAEERNNKSRVFVLAFPVKDQEGLRKVVLSYLWKRRGWTN